tara:strand:- start:102 stop:647 length:546 start_codon:yes stop_codon:yes gene_type:complete
MARPRIGQFAGDLGIGYGKAKNLVEEGRRRKDGGSQILESNMNKMQTKVDKVAKGLKKASKTHASQAETLDSVEFQMGGSSTLSSIQNEVDKINKSFRDEAARVGRMADIVTKDTEIDVDKKDKKKNKGEKTDARGGVPGRPTDQTSKRKNYAMGGVEADMPSQARGAGAAIRGTKFSGVY